jgi:chromosome segregation ATPase
MSQEKKLYEYINKEMMYADASLPIGSYCICKDTEQLYLYTNRDEFGVELQGDERWVPKYPENLTLYMPEDSYVSPEEFDRVVGNIQAHVETVENDYQSRDNSVLAESKGYTDGKISNIERDIESLEDSIEFVRSGANTEINKLKDQDIQIIGRLERLESGGPDISTELNELNQQVSALETKVNDLDPTTGSYVSKKEYAENNQKISNDITTINAAIANQKSDLEGYKTTVEKTYVKQDTLTEYATKDEVTTAKNEAIGAAVSAVNGSLENYATSDEIKDVYSTKEELNEYKTIVDDTYISNEELNEYKEEVIQHIADVKKEIISEPITYMPSLEVKDEAYVGITYHIM